MARPQKKGLDYFPFDVDFFSDKKIAIVKARFGANGVMLYIYLLCEIYKNGYYIKWDEDYKFIVLDELNLKEATFDQILKFLFNRSLLKSILIKPDTFITSAAIQRRFQEAVKTRKLPVVVNKKLWVLKSDETLSCIKFTREKSKSEINPNKSTINCDKSEIYPQSKVKESKEKSPASGVRLFEIQAYINENRLNVNAEKFYNYYTERGSGSYTECSYNQPVKDGDETELIDLVADSTAENFKADIELTDLQMTVREAVSGLPEWEKAAVAMFYFDGKTLTEIAQMWHRTPEIARKVRNKGLNLLRRNKAIQGLCGEYEAHYCRCEVEQRTAAARWEYSQEKFAALKDLQRREQGGECFSYGDKQRIITLAKLKYIREQTAQAKSIEHLCGGHYW